LSGRTFVIALPRFEVIIRKKTSNLLRSVIHKSLILADLMGRIPKKRVIINLGLRKINLERKVGRKITCIPRGAQNKFGTKSGGEK